MIIAGTGHRPKNFGGLTDPHELMPAIQVLMEWLLDLAGGEPCEVVVGMAEGFDLMLAWAALMLAKQGHPFTVTAALPWPEFCDRIRHARAKSWAGQVLLRARESGHVHEVVKAKPAKIQDPRTGRPVEDSKQINRILYQRNVWMVNRLQLRAQPSNMLLACWDGVQDQRSGTLNTMRYAWRTFGHRPMNCWDYVAAALGIKHRVPEASKDYAGFL